MPSGSSSERDVLGKAIEAKIERKDIIAEEASRRPAGPATGVPGGSFTPISKRHGTICPRDRAPHVGPRRPTNSRSVDP